MQHDVSLLILLKKLIFRVITDGDEFGTRFLEQHIFPLENQSYPLNFRLLESVCVQICCPGFCMWLQPGQKTALIGESQQAHDGHLVLQQIFLCFFVFFFPFLVYFEDTIAGLFLLWYCCWGKFFFNFKTSSFYLNYQQMKMSQLQKRRKFFFSFTQLNLHIKQPT